MDQLPGSAKTVVEVVAGKSPLKATKTRQPTHGFGRAIKPMAGVVWEPGSCELIQDDVYRSAGTIWTRLEICSSRVRIASDALSTRTGSPCSVSGFWPLALRWRASSLCWGAK